MYYIINISFYRVIFLHTKVLGGWDMEQMMVFISAFLVIDAISMTVFANSLWELPQNINKGNIDYHLLRPVSSLFMLSVRDFAADSCVNLFMAFSILIWSLYSYSGEFNGMLVLTFLVLVFFGALLRYLVRMVFIIPTFWFHSGHGLEMIFFNLNRFIERPDRIFKGMVRLILTTVVPFSVMASFPARLLLDGFSISILLHFIVVFLCFTVFISWFWNRGLRAYSSASS